MLRRRAHLRSLTVTFPGEARLLSLPSSGHWVRVAISCPLHWPANILSLRTAPHRNHACWTVQLTLPCNACSDLLPLTQATPGMPLRGRSSAHRSWWSAWRPCWAEGCGTWSLSSPAVSLPGLSIAQGSLAQAQGSLRG